MEIEQLVELVTHILSDNKANDIQTLDISALTDIADRMVICSALSTRHIDALRDKVVVAVKAAGEIPLGVDNESSSGWVLIDLQDLIVHIMLPDTRELYSLEKLWSMTETKRQSESG